MWMRWFYLPETPGTKPPHQPHVLSLTFPPQATSSQPPTPHQPRATTPTMAIMSIGSFATFLIVCRTSPSPISPIHLDPHIN